MKDTLTELDRVTTSLSTNRATSQEAKIEAAAVKDSLTKKCITKGTDEITTTGTTSPLRSILSKTPQAHSQCAVSKRDKPTLASSSYRFDADHDGAISLNPHDQQQPTPAREEDQRRVKLTWGTKVTRLFRRGDVCSPWNAPDLTQTPKEDLSYLEVPTKEERMEARVKRYHFKKKFCAKGPIHRPPPNGYSDESEGENEISKTTVGQQRVRRVIHSASTQDWAQGDESDDEAAVPLSPRRPKRRMSDSHCENMAATKKARVGEHGTLILSGLEPT